MEDREYGVCESERERDRERERERERERGGREREREKVRVVAKGHPFQQKKPKEEKKDVR